MIRVLNHFSLHSESKTQSTILACVFILTVIVQFYCNGHIAYCKWKHYQQERCVLVSGRLRQHNDGEQQQPQNPNPGSPFNNTINNKILPEVKHIGCLLIFLLITFASKASKASLDSTNSGALLETSPIFIFIYDFGTSFLLLLIFPLLFYLSHAELRKYWWDILICKQ